MTRSLFPGSYFPFFPFPSWFTCLNLNIFGYLFTYFIFDSSGASIFKLSALCVFKCTGPQFHEVAPLFTFTCYYVLFLFIFSLPESPSPPPLIRFLSVDAWAVTTLRLHMITRFLAQLVRPGRFEPRRATYWGTHLPLNCISRTCSAEIRLLLKKRIYTISCASR